MARARQLMLPDEFYSFENGVVYGESEKSTAAEEAKEDDLLEAAVLAGFKEPVSHASLTKPEVSSCVTAAGDTKKSDLNTSETPAADSQAKPHVFGLFGTSAAQANSKLDLSTVVNHSSPLIVVCFFCSGLHDSVNVFC